MSEVKICERRNKKRGTTHCYAEISFRRFRFFRKILHRTPDYPTFSMCLAALAVFDLKSKVMDTTRGSQDQSRKERRRIANDIAKDLLRD